MKRSLRDYLVTLVLAVLVFAIVSVFLIQAAEGLMSDVVEKIGSEGETKETLTETQTQEPETVPETTLQQTVEEVETQTKESDRVITFLVLGLDQNKQKADVILFVGLNATKKQMTVGLLPNNTVVPEETGKYQLGQLYSSRSINFYKEFAQSETGIMADYYMAMPPSALANLVDILGGISYNVPEDMYFYDQAQNIKIDLKKGEQTLTGDKAVQLMTYEGYQKGLTGKEDAQIGFIRAFCNVLLQSGNQSRAGALWSNLYHNSQTDFEEEALKEWSDVLFSAASYKQNFTRVPGAKSGVYYAISTPRTKTLFQNYK